MDKASGKFDLHGFCLLQHAIFQQLPVYYNYADTVPLNFKTLNYVNRASVDFLLTVLLLSLVDSHSK